MGVVLKRMMLRAADQIAEQFNVDALVTGEAVAQVSSQTLHNLNVIDKVTEKLVLRPLIVSDKQDIVDCAREIGTAGFAETMPEYCGVISKNPTTRAKFDKIEKEETFFNFAVLNEAIEQAQYSDLDRLDVSEQQSDNHLPILTFDQLSEDVLVIDVRHPDEADEKPLQLDKHTVKEIPFFSLKREMLAMDSDQQYALYCEKGVMSKLHAMYLLEEGFNNILVVNK